MKKIKRIPMILSLSIAVTFSGMIYNSLSIAEEIDLEGDKSSISDEMMSSNINAEEIKEYFKKKNIDISKIETLEEMDSFSLINLYRESKGHEFTGEQIEKYIDGLIDSTPDAIENKGNEQISDIDSEGNIITSDGDKMPNTNFPLSEDSGLGTTESQDKGDISDEVNSIDPGASWLVYSNFGYSAASSYLELPKVEDINTNNNTYIRDVPYMFLALNSDTRSTFGDYGVYFDSKSGAWKGFYNVVFNGVNYSKWNGKNIPLDSKLYFSLSIVPDGNIRFRIIDAEDFSKVYYDELINHRKTISEDGRNIQFVKAITIAQHLDGIGKLNTSTGSKMNNAKYYDSILYTSSKNSIWNDSNVKKAVRQAPTARMLDTIKVNDYRRWDKEDISIVFKQDRIFRLFYDGNGNTSGKAPEDNSEIYRLNDTTKVLDKGNLERKGYEFKGWSLSKDSSRVDYKAGDSIKFNQSLNLTTENDVTLYAKWEKIIPKDLVILDKINHSSYLSGYDYDTVKPDGFTTRAEASTMYFRVMTDKAREYYWEKDNIYSDVLKSSWYNGEISTLSNMGYIKGYDDGYFRPDRDITRAEFATITAKFLESSKNPSVKSGLNDISGHWAENDINKLVAEGIIKGYGDGSFKPENKITRAEAAKIINALLERKPDKERLLAAVKNWKDNPYEAWYYGDIQEASNSHKYYIDGTTGLEVWTELAPERDWVIYKNYLEENFGNR